MDQHLILIVDDDPDDAFFLERALRTTGFTNPVHVAENGVQALAFLETNAGESQQLPAIILLDLKMPDLDGFHILSWIRCDPSCSQIPVVVVTGSNAETDRIRSLQLGAQFFFTKPIARSGFKPITDAVRDLLQRSPAAV